MYRSTFLYISWECTKIIQHLVALEPKSQTFGLVSASGRSRKKENDQSGKLVGLCRASFGLSVWVSSTQTRTILRGWKPGVSPKERGPGSQGSGRGGYRCEPAVRSRSSTSKSSGFDEGSLFRLRCEVKWNEMNASHRGTGLRTHSRGAEGCDMCIDFNSGRS